MRTTIATAALLLLSASPFSRAAEEEKAPIPARVDARVELFSLVFRLAGNPEYSMPNSRSPYSEAAAKQFGPFADHEVVKLARRLRATRGVSYDAVMSLAVHVDAVPTLEPLVPLDLPPKRLDARWRPDEATAFLAAARDFARETGFVEFEREHEKLFAETSRRMEALLAKHDVRSWFDSFLGAKPGADFSVIVGLLNGGSNYGVGVTFPDGSERISPVMGAWEWDESGVPVFGGGYLPTIVHEFCHSYTNPIVEAHLDELRPAAARIWPHVADAMKRQAYATPETLLVESFVRACVLRYLCAEEGEAAAARAAQAEVDRGFAWVPGLAELLADYEANRKEYPTLDAFVPRIAAWLGAWADESETRLEKAPKVVSIEPANGATDVDPAVSEIRIVFDRPMRDGTWSVVGGGPHFPEITGRSSYDAAHEVLTFPVRLKPGWSYELWLNSGRYQGFASADGVPLAPVHVTFATRSE